ncbi:MAG: alpha/beta hydrolase, partial [Candidatus Thorarchaeota archaeon]
MSFDVGRSSFNFGVFKDKEMDWVFKRTLQFMNEKAAEIAECLFAARRIDEEDGESWIREWASLAARVEKLGDESFSKGHTISARDSFMRASNYYRTAEYGTPPSHPKFHKLWKHSVESFHKACHLFSPAIEILEVPFEDKQLPAYYWQPDTSNSTRPTLIVAGGNDSSLEELVFFSGGAAVRRGYNFFVFDHPGHRGAVHLYRDCVKRNDYEVPYGAAIDFLETLSGVDERIAITGYSFGGYVATRVAIHDKRIKALIP